MAGEGRTDERRIRGGRARRNSKRQGTRAGAANGAAARRLALHGLAVALAAGAAAAGAPASAEAAPSIESIKFVTVFDPPDGGTPIRRETPGPDGGTGLTRLNVDADPEDELTANVGLSFDATEGAVAGKLHISRLDYGGILSPSTLPPLPVWVEAVAVLKNVKGGKTERKHVALGYDARGDGMHKSTAPGKFTLDVGSCETPDCKSTPTTCEAPCKGRKTRLAMGVVAPGESLKLTGELSDYANDGGRKDPIRGALDLHPVPGSSSPLVLTLWTTKTETSDEDAPVPTLTHLSMTGNKEATEATAHVCLLPGETYEPKRIADTACEAAAYTDQEIDSRSVSATLKPLPRDAGVGDAHVEVSIADNDRGRRGGLQEIKYDASELVDIDVEDRVVTWRDGKRHEGYSEYLLADVPTRASLELLDESDAPPTEGPEAPQDPESVKKWQTVTYSADGEMRSVQVKRRERIDGALVKRERLYLERLPTDLQVVARRTDEEITLPGLWSDGFDRRSRQTVGLAKASSPIGVIEYSTAGGESTASLPDDMGPAYVYTDKPDGGSQYVDMRLLGAAHGTFTIGRHERREPQHFPWLDPRWHAGMDLLSVTGRLDSTPFRTLAKDGRRVFDVHVNDLPGRVDLRLEPEKGTIDYDGSAPVDGITVHAVDPATVFERATSLDVVLEDVPTDVAVQYPSGTDDDLVLDVEHGDEIGKLELTALGEGDSVPPGVIDAESDGLVLRDLESSEPADDEYVLFARAHGLRHVGYEKAEVDKDPETQQRIDRKQFALDVTSGRDFVVDLEQTGEIKKYTWRSGYDWSDDESRCDTEVVGNRRERIRAVIARIAPRTELGYDKRRSFGKRECFENAYVYREDRQGRRRPVRYRKAEVKDIRYTAGASAPKLDFELADGSTNLDVALRTLPTRLRFCKAHRLECLPYLRERHGRNDASLGTLTLDADDYVTVDLVDCEEEFEDGVCDEASARINDLRLKQFDFWGDLDGLISGTNGDTYWNTADYDYDVETWNGVPWDDGPYSGQSQPFQDAGTGRRARIRADKVDFRFGAGFFARGAHVYWDWIADDEIGDWSPDGTGGVVHCPKGTHWEVDAKLTWVEVHEDWCTSGEADG